ncbi:protein of unknown function [Methylocella tundrae]|uniref:Uncharacterized protein n=1 Tax=Methylocella tundrae TaxID=227605 RepID=A0A4U8Z425_METTU|nr:protein of unknown function [Methylocella tundrae]
MSTGSNRLRLSHRLVRVQEERVQCRSISGSAHGASNSFAPREARIADSTSSGGAGC